MREGEPSVLGRRRELESENGQEAQIEMEATPPVEDPGAGNSSGRSPDDVKDQLARLGTQIRGLQQQVEGLVAKRSDVVAEQASERVAAIVHAAEQSAAEITVQAHAEAAELRDRLMAEVHEEADRVRVEAQADAAKIRTDAHADAARLREDTLIQLGQEVERIVAELQNHARQAIIDVTGGPLPSALAETEPAPPPTHDPVSEPAPDADEIQVEEAVDELQAAAAVLEESLRHLHEIGQGLSEGG